MKVSVDPVTRLEGHLSVSLDIEGSRVTAAYCTGTMYRGFESILAGRDPFDAPQIAQRICGVCPISHGLASSQALESAFGVDVPENGRLLRNLILAANYVQSHILHFYQLSALDFVDIEAIKSYTGSDTTLAAVRDWIRAEQARQSLHPAAPFLPRYEGDYIQDAGINVGAIQHYVEALRIRELCHEMVATFGGKMPHVAAIVPGGVTSAVTVDRIEAYRGRLAEVAAFVSQSYVPDVQAVAQAFPQYFKVGRGPAALLAFGGFPEGADGQTFLAPGAYLAGQVSALDLTKIAEDTGHSWYRSASGLHPSQGQTEPDATRADAYSWVKAPRYAGQVVEVGPLARVLITHRRGTNPALSGLIASALAAIQAPEDAMVSVMGRHLARALEARLLVERASAWLDALKPGEPTVTPVKLAQTGRGVGLLEAPRGALGHWVEIGDGLIRQYQCLVPTTWNCSPRDDQNRPGAVEQALAGVEIADRDNPLEAMRVVRSFDPCLACAVH